MKRPDNSNLNDHAVFTKSKYLEGKNIALLVCGGIAALKTPLLARELRKHGASVTVFISSEGLKYATLDSLEWCSNNKVISTLSPRSEHLSSEAAFDLYLIAPATYNTINKIRHGIADNLITTTIAAAIGKSERGLTKVVIAPTMHGDLHNNILDESIEYLENKGIHFIQPRDQNGKHNLPDLDLIIMNCARFLSRSKLKGTKIIVTGGPTPVEIDSVRRITNKFKGTLGLDIAKELFISGADVKFVYGTGSGLIVPEYIDSIPIRTYNEYLDSVCNLAMSFKPKFGIFSAAVADYQPETFVSGKIPSGNALKSINLKPTKKVIDEVKSLVPEMEIISFKLEYNLTKEALLEIAKSRISKGHMAVVANLGNDFEKSNEHIAYFMSKENMTAPQSLVGKNNIAIKLREYLESK